VPCFFWCVYQYLLLVYCGRTVGMQMAGITLRTFEGRHPNWAERKNRALALVLSGASMGLGFVWAYVDPDMLCWHDRISRTYVAPVS
ncbi:MAG TPA: RDD family protein, partial [Clostridia bacterium]|nr:RDD family protein [Clostridia bacterium]